MSSQTPPPQQLPDDGTIYFWRETEKSWGFLSQWYISSFTAPDMFASGSTELITFTSTEQYMMYHKAVVFKDLDIAKKILEESNPKKQKVLGREVSNFDHATWDKVKESIVEEGNFRKFSRENSEAESMCEMLLETENRLLVEASPYDRIWGVGFGAREASKHIDSWGQNLLGQAIMRARARLRQH